MRMLDRKLLRDMWQTKGQLAAICLVSAAGIAMFVMSLSTLESLKQSQQTYYQRYRFAHVFAHVKRAPLTVARNLASIPGVAQSDPRIVVDVTLSVAGMSEPVTGRLISLPRDRQPVLNRVHLRRGRWIGPGRSDEVLASESFVEANGLEPGDKIGAVINGRFQELTLVGVALSPEYVIQVPAGSMLPDDRRFGVFWMSEDALAAAFDMDGAFNDVTLSLMRGAVEAEVIKRLDQLLDAYGGVGAFGRDDQVSHRYLSDEIQQLRRMSIVMPLIFISVATFLLNVVVARLVNTQREQIAALKAFGRYEQEIAVHYLKLVVAIPLIGVVLGTVAGVRIGHGLTQLYTRFYRFPVFGFELQPWIVVVALLISVVSAVLGTWWSVNRAVRLPPAEAMRPEPPTKYGPTLLERFGFGRWVPNVVRMILRHLERYPLKASLACLGIAMAVAVLVVGSFMEDAVTYLMDFQFHVAQRHDVTITFAEPTSTRVLSSVSHLPGVIKCSAFRSTPTRFRSRHRHHRVGLMGLEPGNDLFRLMNDREKAVNLPADGLLLSDTLAKILDVREGDVVTVEVLEGERPTCHVKVAAVITEFSGTNAYMNRQALNRLLGEGSTISGVFLMIDSARERDLFRELKETPRVAGVGSQTAALQSFRDTIGENLLRMRAFNVMFASIIAFGIVYNTARISLAERSRELATLRVIGFTRAEISSILLGELAVLTLLAIPVGCLLGYGFAALATHGMDTELYRIPLVIERSTYGFAVLVVAIAALCSGLVVRRRLDQLDLVSVLKSKE